MKLRTILMSNYVFICGALSIRITRTTYLKEKYQYSVLLRLLILEIDDVPFDLFFAMVASAFYRSPKRYRINQELDVSIILSKQKRVNMFTL